MILAYVVRILIVFDGGGLFHEFLRVLSDTFLGPLFFLGRSNGRFLNKIISYIRRARKLEELVEFIAVQHNFNVCTIEILLVLIANKRREVYSVAVVIAEVSAVAYFAILIVFRLD